MSSPKDVSAPIPELPPVLNPEFPRLRKRLIGGVNDPRLVSKGKRKASPERCNARRPKMSHTLDRVSELILSISFVPSSSEDALTPLLADVLEP
ncbi:hypothetical protein ACOSQ2_027204 [Xanthoceras sorbifolium]